MSTENSEPNTKSDRDTDQRWKCEREGHGDPHRGDCEDATPAETAPKNDQNEECEEDTYEPNLGILRSEGRRKVEDRVHDRSGDFREGRRKLFRARRIEVHRISFLCWIPYKYTRTGEMSIAMLRKVTISDALIQKYGRPPEMGSSPGARDRRRAHLRMIYPAPITTYEKLRHKIVEEFARRQLITLEYEP